MAAAALTTTWLLLLARDGSGNTPLLVGWAGVRIGESDSSVGNAPSSAFPGEPASDMEMAIANLTYLGFNTERITFKNPDTSGVSWPNPIASNNTRLARTMRVW